LPGNLAQQIAERLHDLSDAIAVYSSKKEILVKGSPKYDLQHSEDEIRSRLAGQGNQVDIISTDPYLLVRIRPAEVERTGIPWVNVVLFLITGATTILAGALWEGVDWISNPLMVFKDPIAVISGGLPFSLSLLAILGFHEFGHYFAARYHGVNVTLPYFIPAPPAITLIGSFGAFIKSKSAFINRKQLLDVGAAGPLSGLVIAIIVLAVGINSSHIQPISEEISGIFFGESLLFKFMTFVIKGPVKGDNVLIISSVAFAGWVGILVTMFNLLPMGQLDGGHISYALFGRFQKKIAVVTLAALAVLSFYWQGWIVWIFIGLLLRPSHPPTLVDELPLGRGRKITGLVSILAFILCFIPNPVNINI